MVAQHLHESNGLFDFYLCFVESTKIAKGDGDVPERDASLLGVTCIVKIAPTFVI